VVFPELKDPDASLPELQRLCLHAQDFTSFVSIEPPNALLLEIKGSLKLFGSLETLQAAIDARWRRLELQTQCATLSSTLAALWSARGGRAVHSDDHTLLSGQLAPLPIACTAWNEECLHTLRAMGVNRIGELLRLPRAGLARRLSPAVVRDLDIALARQAAPRRAFVPRQRFRERRDFEAEIEQVAYLEQAMEPLIEHCARFLRQRQAGVQRLKLKLRHREEPSTEVLLGLASITSERRRLSEVIAQKLQRLELKAPVRGIELISGALRALSAVSLDAFTGLAGAGGRDTAPQLVERLRARLGEAAVYAVGLIAEHRPEAAWRRVQELPLAAANPKPQASVEAAAAGMPRPVWLLEAPLPLEPPDILQGPERIESGWWDGKGVARDYYVARRGQGARLWVFQERQTKLWYLHGVFA
jgi:protein ImuB